MEPEDTFPEEKPFPIVSDELFAELDRVFPEVNMTITTTAVPEHELWMNIGRRNVVLFLKYKMDEAREARIKKA